MSATKLAIYVLYNCITILLDDSDDAGYGEEAKVTGQVVEFLYSLSKSYPVRMLLPANHTHTLDCLNTINLCMSPLASSVAVIRRINTAVVIRSIRGE
jgi:hypothetical protein